MPFVGRPGVVFEGQARFHPRKYLAGLAKCIDGGGSHIFEHTESEEVLDAPLSVKAGGHTISCNQIVIATHTPLMGKTNIASATLLQTKLYLYTSYVLGGRVKKGTIPDALFWDTASPYHYLRLDPHRDYDYAIFGGEDHKTGQAADTERVLSRPRRRAAAASFRRSTSRTAGPARSSRRTTACRSSARPRHASSPRPATPATA